MIKRITSKYEPPVSILSAANEFFAACEREGYGFYDALSGKDGKPTYMLLSAGNGSPVIIEPDGAGGWIRVLREDEDYSEFYSSFDGGE